MENDLPKLEETFPSNGAFPSGSMYGLGGGFKLFYFQPYLGKIPTNQMVYGKYTIHGSHWFGCLVIIRCCFCSTSTRWWWIYSQRKPCDHGIFGRKVPWISKVSVSWVKELRNFISICTWGSVSGKWFMVGHVEGTFGKGTLDAYYIMLNYVSMCIISWYTIVYVVLFHTISYCN